MSVKFKQDLERDAKIVSLTFSGQYVQAGVMFDMKPDDLLAHGKWLATQPKAYRDKVVVRVGELLDGK